MRTTKTLAIAALAALSLGIGSAIADEGGPDFSSDAEYRVQPKPATAYRGQTPARTYAPAAGSADRAPAQPYLGVSDFSTAGAD